MPRKAFEMPEGPIGPILEANLVRLGYAEMVVRSTEVAKKVTERTGKKISRQRISALLNAVNVEPATIELLAEGLGVKPSELVRKPEKKPL